MLRGDLRDDVGAKRADADDRLWRTLQGAADDALGEGSEKGELRTQQPGLQF